MLVLRRIALPFINASFITAGLFMLMYSLVRMDEPELLRHAESPVIKFATAMEDSDVNIVSPRPKEPDLIDIAPHLPKLVNDFIPDIEVTGGWIEPVIGPKGIDSLLPADRQLSLAMGFPPDYPSSKIARGVEGYVVVGFSVSAAGEVYDAYVLESEPEGVFDRSALKAIMQFRYHARTIDGKPVSTDGQRYMFRYELDNG